MSNSISLSSSQRSALLNLQQTTDLANRTTLRLSSGRAVNSVSDNAVNFFRSRSLNNRSSDLSDRRTDISQGIQTLNVALEGTDAVDTLLKQVRGIVESTRSATSAERKDLGVQFVNVLNQLSQVVNDSSYQGLNLLNNTGSQLTVSFSERTASRLTVSGFDLNSSTTSGIFTTASVFSSGGNLAVASFSTVINALGGSKIGTGTSATTASFTRIGVNNSGLKAVSGLVARIDLAINKVRSNSQTLGNNAAILQTRLDFTNRYITRLSGGADNLVNADLNEEGANLLALQTRQQLSINALSLSSQQQSAILQLIR